MAHVLVLDGFDETRERTVTVLERAGFSVSGVAEEDDALRMIETDRFELVLLDLPLDETLEGAAAIRDRSQAPTILALLDPTDAAQRERARDAGIDFIVLRPCPPSELVKHLRRFVR